MIFEDGMLYNPVSMKMLEIWKEMANCYFYQIQCYLTRILSVNIFSINPPVNIELYDTLVHDIELLHE